MKRVLPPLAVGALVLALSACGSDSADSPSDSSAPADVSSSTSEPSTAAPTGPSTNDQVREACEKGVLEKVAGATFPNPGTLRVASSAEGKQYTVTGTAQVSGAPQSYTCAVVAGTDKVELTEVTVG